MCHASSLRALDGTVGDTALVIEPAKASEVAPISCRPTSCPRASGRSPQLIPRRASCTADLASRLFLSTHTVHDYVKAILGGRGRQRGELVAKLFAEHYAPVNLDPTQRDRTGT